jgi:hypothetical protein
LLAHHCGQNCHLGRASYIHNLLIC